MTDSNGHEPDPRAATSKLDTTRQRGLVIISALINFIDWLDVEDVVDLPEKERA